MLSYVIELLHSGRKAHIRLLACDLKKIARHVIYGTRILLRIQKAIVKERKVIFHVGNIHW